MQGDDFELENMTPTAEETSARQPLISSRGHDPEQTQHAPEPHLAGEHDLAETTLRNAGRTVWLLTFSAGISGLLFGYDTGVVSSTLVSIGTDLGGHFLSTGEKSVITAVTSLAALVVSPMTGYFADQYGRWYVILLANLVFIVGALTQAFAVSLAWMVLGRAFIGGAIGLASSVTPLYISELSPAEIRGRLVTIQSLFITGGQVVAYVVGWLLASLPAGWRWMVGLGAAPAFFQLFLLFSMLESPRWLMKAGRDAQARSVLLKVYGGLNESQRHRNVDYLITSIETEIAEEQKLARPEQSWLLDTTKQLVQIPGNRRALTIACMLHGLQQLCGFNSLMYFSGTIFALVGFESPIGASLSIALTNFLLTIAAFNYIDSVGRRRILLGSIPFMIIGLLLCSVAFQFINIHDPTTTPATARITAWPVVLLLSMVLYVAAYAIGLGCVPWQQSELFPLQVRSLGSAIATAANWSSNFVIGSTFLPMMDALGASSTFLLYAVVCLIGWMCIWRIYPETAGLELENVGELLKDGWGVKQSVERFRNRGIERNLDVDDGS